MTFLWNTTIDFLQSRVVLHVRCNGELIELIFFTQMIPECFSSEMQNLIHNVLAKDPEDRPRFAILIIFKSRILIV